LPEILDRPQPTETPLLDAMESQLFGTTPAERSPEDLALEHELAAGIERERATAEGGLTEVEERAIFGPDAFRRDSS